MILAITTVVFSYFFEAIISNYIALSSKLFLPLFTLISFLIIYPFFYHHKHRYYFILFFTGIIYDIAYTDTILFHAVLYVCLGFLIQKLYDWMSGSIWNILFMSLLLIFVYRTSGYLVLSLIGYLTFSSSMLLETILASLLLNGIYAVILYKLIDWMSRKFRIIKME